MVNRWGVVSRDSTGDEDVFCSREDLSFLSGRESLGVLGGYLVLDGRSSLYMNIGKLPTPFKKADFGGWLDFPCESSFRTSFRVTNHNWWS